MEGHGYKPKVRLGRSRKRQPHKCNVPLCTETQKELHTVPKDYRKNDWEISLGMKLKDSYRVCSNHFDPLDYIPSNGLGLRPNLKRTAIPAPVTVEIVNVSSVTDREESRRRQEILRDLEEATTDMMISAEDMPALQVEVRDLLCSISSDECRVYVESYIKSNTETDASIQTGGFGPFTLFPAMQEELMGLLDRYEEDYGVSPGFLYGEILNEVIIWATISVKNCTRQEAEIYFKEMCSKIEVKKP